MKRKKPEPYNQAIINAALKAFEEYIGKTQEELIGKNVYDLAPKELADIYLEKDKELLEKPTTQEYETQVKYADGTGNMNFKGDAVVKKLK